MIEIKRDEATKMGLEIIAFSKKANASVLEAFKLVHQGKKDEARKKIATADVNLKKAQQIQEHTIEQETQGAKVEYSLVLTHAQTHLATTCSLLNLYVAIMQAGEE